LSEQSFSLLRKNKCRQEHRIHQREGMLHQATSTYKQNAPWKINQKIQEKKINQLPALYRANLILLGG